MAEIHWLLLILVLVFMMFDGAREDAEAAAAIASGAFFYAALVMSFRYANFYKRETRWKIALETWGMIAFVTWTLRYADCHWVHLLSLDRHYERALVEAERTDEGFNVTTSNVRVLRSVVER